MSKRIYDTKIIAAQMREILKEQAPDCKFSVTRDVNSITIALMQAPFPVFANDTDSNGNVRTRQYAQLNHYAFHPHNFMLHTERMAGGYKLTEQGWNVLAKAAKLATLHNWDNSDISADYFDVNYYFNLHVGKWNKYFQVKA
jgi:hypothetical protein